MSIRISIQIIDIKYIFHLKDEFSVLAKWLIEGFDNAQLRWLAAMNRRKTQPDQRPQKKGGEWGHGVTQKAPHHMEDDTPNPPDSRAAE